MVMTFLQPAVFLLIGTAGYIYGPPSIIFNWVESWRPPPNPNPPTPPHPPLVRDSSLILPTDALPSPSPALATPPPHPVSAPAVLLRPWREAFEHNVMPISKLIFPEGMLV